MNRSHTKFFLFFLLFFARIAGAQNGATVSGVVHDSIADAPLEGATVQLIATNNQSFVRTADTDSLGHYILRDIPIGHYSLGFLHPLLDSIGVEAPLRDLYVDGSKPLIVNLAVPSPARLRAAICGPQGEDDGGLIVGTVRNGSDESPAIGATVTGEWLEYSIGKGGLSRHVAHRVAAAGDNGWFALCNVPTGGSVALVASKGADSTGTIEIKVPTAGFARQELYLGKATSEVLSSAPSVMSKAPPIGITAPSPASSRPFERRIHVGSGRINGTVVTVTANKPVANALVTIIDGPQTRTNSLGEWSFTNAPGGTQTIEVRALGYYPTRRSINVVRNVANVRVALSTLQAMLDTVKITASRLANGSEMIGFNDRQKKGFGHFLTEEDVKKFNPINTTDLLRLVPGLRLTVDSVGEMSFQLKGVFEPWCSPAIYIDGQEMSFLNATEVDSWVHTRDIAGIEVYTESNVPPQFNPGLKGCGSVVIWTKRGMAR